MSDNKSIWMPLYVADYLSSTTRLTTEQHGAYLLLIMDYWKNGRLPNDDHVLSQITRMSIERWGVLRGVLEGFFEVTDKEWIHTRIEKELEQTRSKLREALMKSILGNYKRHGTVDTRVQTDPVLKEWWESLSLKESPKESLKESLRGPQSQSQSHIKDITTTVASDDAPASKEKKSPEKKLWVGKPDDVDPEYWEDFIGLRKAKKLVLTETALKGLRDDATKYGMTMNELLLECCKKGWAAYYPPKDFSGRGVDGRRTVNPWENAI